MQMLADLFSRQHPWMIELGWILIHTIWIGALAAALGALATAMLDPTRARLRCAVLLLLLAAILPSAWLWRLAHPGPSVTADATRPTRFEDRVLADNDNNSRSGVDAAKAAGALNADHRSTSQAAPDQTDQGNVDFAMRAAKANRLDRDGVSAAGESPAAGTAAASPITTRLNSLWVQLQARMQTWLPSGVAVWLLGVFLLSVRLTRGWLRCRRCFFGEEASDGSAAAQQSSDGLAAAYAARPEWTVSVERLRRLCLGPVRVIESAAAHIPATIGMCRPVVLVPTAMLSNMTPQELEAILAHELAHVYRLDFAANLFQTVVETLLFFHPAVWWLSRTVRAERERACDDWALELTSDRLAYARAMTEAAALAKQHELALAAANSSMRSDFARRMRRVLLPAQPQRLPTHALCLTLWAVVAALMLAPLLHLPQAEAEQQPNSPRSTAPLAPPPPAENARDAAVSGVVRDAQGQAIANATLRLVVRPQPHWTHHETLATATSDANGGFQLRGFEWPQLAGRPTPLAVVVTTERHGMEWQVIQNARENLEFNLSPAVPFSGVVVDADGKAVSGARVTLLHLMSLKVLQEIDLEAGSLPRRFERFLDAAAIQRTTTETGDDGRFEFTGVGPNMAFAFEVDHPRFVHEVQFGATSKEALPPIRAGHWVIPPRDRSPNELLTKQPYVKMTPVHSSGAKVSLTPAVACAVQLAGPQGEPLEGVTVYKAANSLAYSPRREQVTSGADGRCVFTQCDPELKARFSVQSVTSREFNRRKYEAGEQQYWLPASISVEAKQLASQTHLLKLTPGAVLEGEVHSATGEPLEHVSLSFVAPKQGEAPAVQTAASTDSKGRYLLIAAPRNGELHVRGAPNGSEFDRDRVVAQVTLEERRVTTQDLTLAAIPELLFQFVDESDNPVKAEAEVRVYSSSSSATVGHLQTEANEGIQQFNVAKAMRSGQPAVRVEFIARSPDGKRASFFIHDNLEKLREQQPVRITLQPLASVAGVVTDKQTGKPIAGAAVSISIQYDARRGRGVARVKTGEDGRYRYDALVANAEHSLGCHADGYHSVNSVQHRIDLAPGETRTKDVLLAPKPAANDAVMAPKVTAPDVSSLEAKPAYETLLSKFQIAQEAYQKAPKDKQLSNQVVVDRMEPRQVFVPAMLSMAKRHADSAVAEQALIWIAKQSFVAGTGDRYQAHRQEACQLLASQHLDAPALAAVASDVIFASGKRLEVAEQLMKSKEDSTRAVATLTLARIFSAHYQDPRIGGEDSVRERAIELFESVQREFPQMKINRRSLSEQAEIGLFRLRELVVGQPAPALVGTDQAGQPMRLSDFRGKVVLLHHWSGTLHDWSRAQQMAKRYAGEPLVVLGICDDSADDTKLPDGLKVRTWCDPERKMVRKWTQGIPDFHVIDHVGRLVYKGERLSYGQPEDAVRAALEAAKREQ